MYASENGHLDVVNRLLNYREIDVNLKNYDGDTALKLAFNKKHKEIFQLLKRREDEAKTKVLEEDFKHDDILDGKNNLKTNFNEYVKYIYTEENDKIYNNVNSVFEWLNKQAEKKKYILIPGRFTEEDGKLGPHDEKTKQNMDIQLRQTTYLGGAHIFQKTTSKKKSKLKTLFQ